MFKFGTNSRAVDLANLHIKMRKLRNPSWGDVGMLLGYLKPLDEASAEALEDLGKGDTQFFSKMVTKILPIWENFVVHDEDTVPEYNKYLVNSLLGVLKLDNIAHPARTVKYKQEHLLHAAEKLFVSAYEQDVSTQTFNEWVERLQAWMLFTGDDSYLTSTIWEEQYDLKIISKFVNSRWDFKRANVLDAIVLDGHSPDIVYRFGVPVARAFPADTLSELAKTTAPKTLKSLLSLDACGREALTVDVLVNLVKVGFVSDKEVRDYARKFGVDWADGQFFTRLIKAKTLYPDLDAYVSVI